MLKTNVVADETYADALACPRCRRALDCERCACGFELRLIDGVAVLLADCADPATRTFYEHEQESRYGRSEMPSSLAQLVRRFLDSIDEADIVVELGSGRCLFAGWHPRLVLADYSLRALVRFGSGPRIHLDAQQLPFRDGSIDAFFSIATFEHVPRPELALGEIDRCLVPGGRALLFPAWLVFPWAAKNLARRRYRELGVSDRVRKALIPVRSSPAYRFASVVPSRLRRELRLLGGGPLPFDYRRLAPTLDKYLTSDSDAFTSMDPHACVAFFVSRGYEVPGAPGVRGRLALGYVQVEVRKPGAET